MLNKPILQIKNLSLSFQTNKKRHAILNNISFALNNGKTLGIVGESGSGKSVTALSIMRLLKSPPAQITNGQILFSDQDLLLLSELEMQKIRGSQISMIFQEPMTALNPVFKIGNQIQETILLHQAVAKNEAKELAQDILNQVGIPDPHKRYHQYPHEFSGGQRQRILIAMSIVNKPKLLIADEPTTALDVTVQRQILDLLLALKEQYQMSMLFISHDLGVIKYITDETIVMRRGEIVERGVTSKVFSQPEHAYSKQLLACRQKLMSTPKTPSAHSNNLLLKVNNLSVSYASTQIKAVNSISLSLFKGQILGIVGESGSGKSTLGKAILKLLHPQCGQIEYDGVDVTTVNETRFKHYRKKIQIVFQDPYSSLNPRMKVISLLLEPMFIHQVFSTKLERLEFASELLHAVGLDDSFIHRYPHQLSGGQRQRICLARALAVKPEFIICDESVSALDVSIQSQILDLLMELKKKYSLTYIFISHDLAVIRYLADYIIVMQNGQCVEMGETEKLFQTPTSSYTKKLLDSILI